jgi:membrane protein, antimicrobial resistance system
MGFLNIYTSPSQTFTKLSEKPKWLIPLIIVVIFSILLTIVAVSKTNWDEQRAKVSEMMQKRNVPQERIDKIMNTMNPKTGMIRGIIAMLIMTPIGILIFTLILNLLIPILGTSGLFKKTFAVTTHSALVRVPGAIVKAILMFVKGSSDISTSLMLFFPKMTHQGFVYGLFSKIDFFTIWELILVGLGLKVLFNISGKKTYYVVFGLWLLYIIITSFLSPTGMG